MRRLGAGPFMDARRGRAMGMMAALPGGTVTFLFTDITPLLASARPEPMRRLATPADIDNTAALLWAEAGFITGRLIHVDRGASLMNVKIPRSCSWASGTPRSRSFAAAGPRQH